jgi:hypothetical protein
MQASSVAECSVVVHRNAVRGIVADSLLTAKRRRDVMCSTKRLKLDVVGPVPGVLFRSCSRVS